MFQPEIAVHQRLDKRLDAPPVAQRVVEGEEYGAVVVCYVNQMPAAAHVPQPGQLARPARDHRLRVLDDVEVAVQLYKARIEVRIARQGAQQRLVQKGAGHLLAQAQLDDLALHAAQLVEIALPGAHLFAAALPRGAGRADKRLFLAAPDRLVYVVDFSISTFGRT